MRIKKSIALGLCIVLCLGMLAAGCAKEQEGGLKDFSAKTLDGEDFAPEDLSDKDLTMVNFWGTFCSPCIAEMPDLAEFAKVLPENVQLITVCVDGEYEPEDARMLLEQAGFEGITLVSGDGDFTAILNDVQGVPTTMFLDSEGNRVGGIVEGGGLTDFSGFYLEKINQALKACGKEEIRLEE